MDKIAIKKDSVLLCPKCDKVAYIAKCDIEANSRLQSAQVKTPYGECQFGEQVKCIHCNYKYLDITSSLKWREPDD